MLKYILSLKFHWVSLYNFVILLEQKKDTNEENPNGRPERSIRKNKRPS